MDRKEKKLRQERDLNLFKMGVITAITAVIALVFCALFLWQRFGNTNKQPAITNDYIESRIAQVAKLTTAEMTYRGIISFTEGEIPLINQKHFNAIYEAKVNVGIDASEIKVEATDEKVVVRLPKAKVIDEVNVLPDSLRFYDERTSLFNPIDTDDVPQALQKAQEDAKLNANAEGIMQKADEQAKELMQAFFPPELLGERKLEIISE
ncbi:MAG: DUF4230 domain-containing protein [Lachnospiraceae bacterium]|nr:DUF4230 domain-containing protein [Lachnospiraceae bacterium]